MNTQLNKGYSEKFASRMDELSTMITTLKENKELSKNTIHTKTFHLQRELKICKLVMDMLTQLKEEAILDDMDVATLNSLASLQCEKKYTPPVIIEVSEGDKITDLLERYSTVKNLYQRLQQACTKQGLYMNTVDNKIEKTLS